MRRENITRAKKSGIGRNPRNWGRWGVNHLSSGPLFKECRKKNQTDRVVWRFTFQGEKPTGTSVRKKPRTEHVLKQKKMWQGCQRQVT